MRIVKDFLPVVVSTIALIISGVTFFLSNLYDPGPTFFVSSEMEWTTNTADTETFVLAISVVNQGTNIHVLNEMILQIRQRNSDRKHDFRVRFYQEKRPETLEFVPVTIPPNSSVGQSFLFTPAPAGRNQLWDTANRAQRNFSISAGGTYFGELLAKINGERDPVSVKRFRFTVSDREARSINRAPRTTRLYLSLDVI